MRSIKDSAKEWCSEHSNKDCKEQCDGCWQLKQPWGCEQHNMEMAYEAGANYVLECVEDIIVNNEDNTLCMARCLVDCIEQLKK